MPELPEVETVARQLAPLIEGRRVLSLEILDKAKLPLANPGAATGRIIGEVRRVGKQVVIELRDPEGADPPLWLCVHLRMTGRLAWVRRMEPALERSLRARLKLDQGWLIFRDVRRFGTFELLSATEGLDPGGIEPFSAGFTPGALAEKLAGSRQEIKPWLLRQDRLVGLGNIYAAEALFDARIGPLRQAGSITPREIRRLHKSVLKILTLGIECGGTTFSDFQDARGESGAFQKRLTVYGRAGEPCKRCATPIARIVQQGRSTFYCPQCQDGKRKA